MWLLLACVLLPLHFAPGASAQDPPVEEPLAVAWSRLHRGAVALAISPDGSRVVAAALNGVIRCWDQNGALCWERQIPGVDRLEISRNGELTLAYTARQPRRRQVSFLDRTGRRFHVLEAPAPIATAVLSLNGRFAAIAAGRSLMFWGQSRRGVRQRQIVLEGEPQQVQFGPGDSVYAACTALGTLELIKSTGRVLWRRELPNRRLSSISASEDGRVVAMAGEYPPGKVTITLIDSRNLSRWSVERDGRAPLVRLSADGDAVLLAYEHRVEHLFERRFEQRFERRLAYVAPGSSPGEVQIPWTKGGAFTAPYYVSVERKGEWVVALDAHPQRTEGGGQLAFRLYDGPSGGRRWIYTSPSAILIAVGSTEGRHIATYRADGVVELLKVSAR